MRARLRVNRLGQKPNFSPTLLASRHNLAEVIYARSPDSAPCLRKTTQEGVLAMLDIGGRNPVLAALPRTEPSQ
jgi:hypothetical protein